jgi:hypothetical protein
MDLPIVSPAPDAKNAGIKNAGMEPCFAAGKPCFATKAETLERVAPVLHGAAVLPLAHFTVAQWRAGRNAVLDRLAALSWTDGALIVRSSAVGEDSGTQSMAGRFLSVPDVAPGALPQAIDAVIASYGADTPLESRVLVQPMLSRVAVSGVAFSRDPNTGAPYVVINFETNGDTAAVTGGAGRGLRTVYLAKHSDLPFEAPLGSVVALVRELESLFGRDGIDVEFAVDHQGRLFLLQVRPLIHAGEVPVSDQRHYALLTEVAEKITAANRQHPYLFGPRTVYGVMPDWNPAEIVGIRPRPLALSLYREIVTDAIWAYQRNNYGYKNLRSFPLLVDFHGLPYVDVRVSFNSFIPSDIEPELAERLVDHYISTLIKTPALHDKVEFEIVFSCYTFDLPDEVHRLERHGFTSEECATLTGSLKRLTNRIIDRDTGFWRRDMERIDTLIQRRAQVMGADMDPVSRIYWLLEDCKRYGTLPFAGLARAGFIAIQMLRSLVKIGILSERDTAAFMSGLNTVSTCMGRDLDQLDRTTFLSKYGHLRPGTYDILSHRYDEAPDQYFDWKNRQRGAVEERRHFSLSLEQMRAIDRLLAEHGLDQGVVSLFDFLEAGIRGREFSKFVFTNSLSDALSLFRQLGLDHGFSVDDVSHASIRCIYDLYSSSTSTRETLETSIARGRELYARTRSLVLPPLISSADQVWAFEMPPTDPNFITQRRVVAPIARVAEGEPIENAIALLTNADPGYDWIFSHGIKGFITAYGGVNSHMAIRASELEIPAVIGAGEVLYNQWAGARVLDLDAANRQVRIVQ